MNDKERYRIMVEIRTLLECLSNFKDLIENVASIEEEKLDNVPPSLVDTLGLSEDLDNISQAIDNVDEATSLIEEIVELLEIKMRKERSRRIDYSLIGVSCSEKRNSERRNIRLQILITPSLNAKFRDYCKRCKLTLNEVVNRLMENIVE